MPIPIAEFCQDSLDERQRVLEFLRESAEKIFGKGIYSKDGKYDHVAVYWMTESLELAADAIERHEHLEQSK
jgi:hypothetical protein